MSIEEATEGPVAPAPTGHGRQLATRLVGVLVVVVLAATAWSILSSRDADAPPDVVVTGARSGERVGTTVAVYATIENRGGADRLRAASSSEASRVVLHTTDEVSIMRTGEDLDLPGGSTVSLQPGGDHLMLEGVGRDLQPGDRFTVRLDLERSGPVDVEVVVVPLEELVEVGES